jgi:DNA-binding XRE family transcriptional regulator
VPSKYRADWLIEKRLLEKGPLDPYWRERERYGVWPLPELVLFGARIRHGRQQAGMSQRRLADKAGVSQSLVSRLERGVAHGMSAMRLVAVGMAIGPTFPFGFCSHDHPCKWSYDPTNPKQVRPPRPLLPGD